MTAEWLLLLAVVDSTFCGYRAAAGRSALIDKRRHYGRAMRRGAAWGFGAVLLAGLAIFLALAASSDPDALRQDLKRAGDRMLQVYMPYAVVLGLAFFARAWPSVDVRSLTSTLVFGPLTLLRVPVLVAGIVWGVMSAPRPVVVALAAFVLTMMLGMERALGRHYRRERETRADAASPARSQPT